MSEQKQAGLLFILNNCVNDPMWADHVEMTKALIRRTIAELEQLRAENAELKKAQGEPIATIDVRHGICEKAKFCCGDLPDGRYELSTAPQPSAAIEERARALLMRASKMLESWAIQYGQGGLPPAGHVTLLEDIDSLIADGVKHAD